MLPSGEICNVEGSRWDFRKLHKIVEGYDNCFCLDGPRGTMKHGLTLRDPKTGRTMEVWTTECAIQMYTAIRWDGTVPAKSGSLQPSQGFAIEPQNYPDAPNNNHFPSSILLPNEIYNNKIIFEFSVL